MELLIFYFETRERCRAWIIRNRRPTFPSSSPPDLEFFKRGNKMKMSQQAGSNPGSQDHIEVLCLKTNQNFKDQITEFRSSLVIKLLKREEVSNH